jgi:hypothetical protein
MRKDLKHFVGSGTRIFGIESMTNMCSLRSTTQIIAIFLDLVQARFKERNLKVGSRSGRNRGGIVVRPKTLLNTGSPVSAYKSRL